MKKFFLGKAYKKNSNRIRNLSENQKKIVLQINSMDSSLDYEEASCICNSADPLQFSEIDRYGISAFNNLCKNCGTIWLSPRWNQERYNKFYENSYRNLYSYFISDKEKYIRQLFNDSSSKKGTSFWLNKKLKDIHLNNSMPKALEIGAGAGWTIAGLSGTWKKFAYDVDEDFINIGKKLFDINFKKGFLRDSAADINDSDLIILSHVFEHFLNPKVDLKFIFDNMKNNSYLFIEVPGIFNIHKNVLNPMTYMQNVHVFTYSREVISELLKSVGFTILFSDERVRIIAKKEQNNQSKKFNFSNKKLVNKTYRYLMFCEIGIKIFFLIRKIPFTGRVLGFIWRKFYFNFGVFFK